MFLHCLCLWNGEVPEATGGFGVNKVCQSQSDGDPYQVDAVDVQKLYYIVRRRQPYRG